MAEIVVTSYTPTLDSGRGKRVYGVVRALAEHGDVHVIYNVFGGAAPSTAFNRPRILLDPVVSSRGARRGVAYARAVAAGVPAMFARGVSPELAARASEVARSQADARVVADGPTAAAALLRLAHRQPVVYNAHNIESDLRVALGEPGTPPPARLAAFEKQLLETFAETWTVSTADFERARELAPSAQLRYVPNVVDVSAITPAAYTGAGRVLFAADFTYTPNRDAFAYLASEVLSELLTVAPEARLVVTGRGSDGLGPDPRIDLLGFVDDLAAVYRSVDCVVVPLRFGGGSPLKFVEALAYGVPVVATSVAARGLDVVDGVHFLRADGSRRLAELTAQALKEPNHELRAAARGLAEQEYSIETLGRLLRR
ncbi:MAG TPA: glycosyltransferase family 4 protein [Gaiellaceae bacterium]|nr:glycosyltransferase family 4 protein [Gaiellaceae bacterium]